MNIFDIALQLELDGEQFYRKQAAKVNLEELKTVLLGLADDEQRHYKIIKSLQDQTFVYSEADIPKNRGQNIFKIFNKSEVFPIDEDLMASIRDEQLNVYRAALIKEEESIRFYKKLGEMVEERAAREIVEKLMLEEDSHAEVLENIIQMFNHVNEWVESAEFNHLETY